MKDHDLGWRVIVGFIEEWSESLLINLDLCQYSEILNELNSPKGKNVAFIFAFSQRISINTCNCDIILR